MRYVSSVLFSFLTLLLLCAPPAFCAKTCSVAADGLDFGLYDHLGPDMDGLGYIRVTCSAGASYDVTMATNKLGPGGERELKNAGIKVPYYLFIDSARTILFGDGNRGTASYIGDGNNFEQLVPVYGRLPTGPLLPAGIYTDTIRVFVYF